MAENSGDLSLGYMMGQSEGNSGGFGGNFGEGLWAVIILAILFGRGGFGGGFGGGGYGGEGVCATQADVRAAVDQQTLISKIDQQTYGLSDVFNSLNTNLNNNFRGLDNAICTLGFQNQQGFSGLGAQLASCCCDIERGQDRIANQITSCCCDLEKMNMQNRFDAQAYNNSTLIAIDKLGDRIIDFMNCEKTQALRDENQALRLAASQSRQNQYLIDQLRPCPVPAYITCNPYAASWGTGYNNGCGCGCG